MQIGVVYPQIELRGDPHAARRIALATEELGFDHFLAYDHVLGAVHDGREPALTGPYTERDPFHDPFVLFAHLAALTSRIEFVSGVIILPQRQTALVARQAADVDLLSGERFRLGIGVGWNHVEYEALGEDFHTRGARQEEQIGLLRALWSEPVVTHAGRFDRVDRAALLPQPLRPIPIWLGGWGAAAFERAARLGDGFIFGGGAKDVLPAWATMRERVAQHGRSVEAFGGEWIIPAKRGADDVVAKIEGWAEAGGTHASVVTMGMGLDSAEAHIDVLAKIAAALGR